MKKSVIKISLFFLGALLVFIPFGIFLLVGNSQPHVYSKTYYAALVDKVHNLDNHKKDKKIILVGGSNVAFGFNSQLLEDEFSDYTVVNFGLYAMLGTRIMMDLAINNINEGDMVFLVPEINPQSTSLYFDSISTLKALEDDMSIINRLPKDNKDNVIGSYFDFVKKRSNQKDVIEPTGVYQRKNFESHGDISFDELDEDCIPLIARNRMTVHYDPTMKVDYSYEVDEKFLEYVNEFDNQIKKKKAKLYYSFSPVNKKAVIDEEKTLDYYWYLRERLSCEVIGNPNDYIISPHYFFDSNFHLNDSGAIYRTYLLAQDIYRDVLKSPKQPSFDIPDQPPFVDDGDIDDDSETAICFDYIDYEDSLMISGVKDEYKRQTNIVLPKVANGKRVVGISKNAFEGCPNINNIVILKSISILMDGCFGNCPSLTDVYIETMDPSDIIVSYTGSMIEGVTDGFKIHIHSDAYDAFATDYYWANYLSYFERFE